MNDFLLFLKNFFTGDLACVLALACFGICALAAVVAVVVLTVSTFDDQIYHLTVTAEDGVDALEREVAKADADRFNALSDLEKIEELEGKIEQWMLWVEGEELTGSNRDFCLDAVADLENQIFKIRERIAASS